MKKTILTLALITTAAGAAFAQAATQAPGPKADPLGDRTVTKAEFVAEHAKMFDKLDVNKDGKLDDADREAQRAQMQTAMFDRLDTNKDGNISRAEFAAGRPQHDADGPPKGERGERGERGKRGERGGKMMLRMADTNKDGAISRDEFAAAHGKMFDLADANKDGKLTPAERKAQHDKMRDQMGKHDKRGPGGQDDMPPPPPAD